MSSKDNSSIENKYIFIDDSVAGVGGTALTLEGIIEPQKDEVSLIPTSEVSLTLAMSSSPCMWIFGNITNLSPPITDAILWIMENCPFVKIEFDYGYCPYRGPIPHLTLNKEECKCPQGTQAYSPLTRLYNLIHERARHIFYMSDLQMNMHLEALNQKKDDRYFRLSSCFQSDSLSLMDSLLSTPKNKKFAIIDGNGGWHTQAKGISQSIAYAEEKELLFDLIKTSSNAEMLKLLSTYRGLIFLPLIHDTCPRITIEAKLLGLEVITDLKSQHIAEEWWKFERNEIKSYLQQRPLIFWKTIND